MYITEILLTKESYTAQDWRNLVLVSAKHLGGISPLSLCIVFKGNQVFFYFESDKDASQLSSGLDGFLLRPVDEDTLPKEPADAKKIGLLKLPNGGSLLDIKEQYKLKYSKDLTLMRLKVRRFGDKLNSTMECVFEFGGLHFVNKQHLTLFPAHFFVFTVNEVQNYIFASLPKYLSLEKTLHIMNTDPLNSLFSVSGFPYSSKDYYLSLGSYEFDKHSLIVGASGSGKSRLIQLIVDRLAKHGTSKEYYRVIVIDPHASLEQDLRHISGSRIVNLGNESAQLFPDANADISAATELTTTLFKSLLASQYNPRLERVLRFSVYVLLTAQIMSLDMLKQFLTDLDTRMKVTEHVGSYVPQNIQQFFATDFNELRTQYYNESILPIVSLVDEMQLQPSLVGEATQSLYKTISENFLTVFSLNKVSMGEKAVKTVAGLLIQQIFLLAQAKVLPYKMMLVIDEVSVVQNPSLAAILAEARKFNLSVVLTQQYFSQVDDSIQDAIMSNTVNYYMFRVSEEDARKLEGNIVMEIPKEVLLKGQEKGRKEADQKVDLLIEQSARDCIVRLSAGGQLLPAIKARTQDIGNDNPAVSMSLEPRAELKKLPPKMEFNSEPKPVASLQQATDSPLEVPKLVPVAAPTIDAQEFNSVNIPTPQFINIQQILADQSSSREDAKKGLEL